MDCSSLSLQLHQNAQHGLLPAIRRALLLPAALPPPLCSASVLDDDEGSGLSSTAAAGSSSTAAAGSSPSTAGSSPSTAGSSGLSSSGSSGLSSAAAAGTSGGLWSPCMARANSKNHKTMTTPPHKRNPAMISSQCQWPSCSRESYQRSYQRQYESLKKHRTESSESWGPQLGQEVRFSSSYSQGKQTDASPMHSRTAGLTLDLCWLCCAAEAVLCGACGCGACLCCPCCCMPRA